MSPNYPIIGRKPAHCIRLCCVENFPKHTCSMLQNVHQTTNMPVGQVLAGEDSFHLRFVHSVEEMAHARVGGDETCLCRAPSGTVYCRSPCHGVLSTRILGKPQARFLRSIRNNSRLQEVCCGECALCLEHIVLVKNSASHVVVLMDN